MNRIGPLRFILTVCVVLVTSGYGHGDTAAPARYHVYFLYDVSKSYVSDAGRNFKSMSGVLETLALHDRYSFSTIESCSFGRSQNYLEKIGIEMDAETRWQWERWTSDEEDELYEFLQSLTWESKSEMTDIDGALRYAIENLRSGDERYRYLVIFSDMQSDPDEGCAQPDATDLDLTGIDVIVADMGITKSDRRNPSLYDRRKNAWAARFNAAHAHSVAFYRDLTPLSDKLAKY